MPREIAASDVDQVWEAWRARQKRPALVRLTEERRKLIRARLKLGYTADELCTLVRYAYESDDDRPRFWRGENAGQEARTYLDIENLLRVHKLGERVPAALAWANPGDDDGDDEGGSGAPVSRSARRSVEVDPEEEGSGGRYAAFRSRPRR